MVGPIILTNDDRAADSEAPSETVKHLSSECSGFANVMVHGMLWLASITAYQETAYLRGSGADICLSGSNSSGLDFGRAGSNFSIILYAILLSV
jgi:hypothetical protein